MDLWKFLDDVNIDLGEKLNVLQHIVGQLKAIDGAGIVLFDRSGGNIRVLSSGKHISTRQMDLAEFYDKKSNALYVESRETYLAPRVEDHELSGLNMWSESVTRLMADFIHYTEKSSGIDLRSRFGKYASYEQNEWPKRDILVELEEDVSQAIKEFNAKKISPT